MKEEAFEQLVVKYLSGEISTDEANAVEKAIQESKEKQRIFEGFKQTWAQVDSYDAVDLSTLPDQDLAWSRFAEEAFVKEAKVVTRSFNWRRLLQVAAAILIPITAIVWMMNVDGPTDQSSLVSVQAIDEPVDEIILPDGSKVWLDRHSTIEYDAAFTTRVVMLSGQAFFEVEHMNDDESFVVRTNHTETTVLGTRFNVSAFEDQASEQVFVESGRVAFERTDQTEEREVLIPGEVGVYTKSDDQVIKKTLEDQNILAWKTQILQFSNAALPVILEAVTNQYGVEFGALRADLLHCTYNSEYEKLGLEEILADLSWGLNLEFSKTDNSTYTVSGKGCQ